ncbi:MAG: hypothetical protein R8K22_07910 [Mariprofundaceae bacterium]
MKNFSSFLETNVISVEELHCHHKDVADIAKMADAPWKVSSSAFQVLSEIRLLDIVVSRPIFCVEVRSKLFVIGGFRSWNILMTYHEKHKKPSYIPVQIVKRKMNSADRKEFAISSLFTPLISHSLGLHGNEYIGHLWESSKDIAPNYYNNFFRINKSTKSRLPKEFKQNFGTFYPKGKSNEQ